MKSSKHFILVILLLVECSTLTQANYFNKDLNPVAIGTILSKDANPVIGAHIVVDGSLISAVTDLNGRFELYHLEAGEYSLQISAIGYKTVQQKITIAESGTVEVQIVFQEEEIIMPEILVIGKSDGLFSHVPGSVTHINSKELSRINALSGNEVLRRSPGLHVPDEEGVGMRANIGIRGLDPDRSRSLLILEDGIPVALAPYGEPEMYYTPPIDRMSGLEILKGSGQILFGPQTIGGVINYLTMNPPAESTGKIKLQVGEGGYLNALFNYGNTINKTGFNVSILKKRADKIGLTSFDITDLNAKLLMYLSEKSSLTLKTGIYDETSNSTYIGLTQTMYDKGGQDFVHMAPDDRLNVRRYSISLIHDYRFNRSTKLRTSAYAYTTTRNWRRQDFASNGNDNAKPDNWTGVTWGEESVPAGAIYMRNSTGNRNRQFEVAALESRLDVRKQWWGLDHQLKIGARYLFEIAHEQRINGTRSNVDSGNLLTDEDRRGHALSAYIQNLTDISPNFEVHYGVRLEQFNYERDIARGSFRINSQNQTRDTILIRENNISQLIPGAGFTWRPVTGISIFGGLHQGFAPPRTKDAISGSGEVYELDPERSTNYEIGFRSSPTKAVKVELTAFYMDFSNQIIPVSESSGGIGSGLVNGGQTIHKGIEGMVELDIAQLAGWSKMAAKFDLNLTNVKAYFSGDRIKDGIDLSRNTTPYAPKLLINSALSLQSFTGWGLRLTANYVSKQFADELNTIEASPDGRIGLIPSYFTTDGNIYYTSEKWHTTFTLSVKNLTNERYIVNRRPQGIRVGLPRWVNIGIEYNF